MADAAEVVAVLTARRIELDLSQRRVGFLSGLGTSVCETERRPTPVADNERQQRTA